MNSTPTKLDLTPTECGDCGGSLARAFAESTRYLRCRRCGHVIAATADQALDWACLDPR